MPSIIFAILFVVAGVAIGLILKKSRNAKLAIVPFLAGPVLAVIIIASSCFITVPTGHTGVITTFGKVEEQTLNAGVHTKTPWQEVILMDNRVQKETVNLMCFSSDIQEVTCKYTLNYQISKANAQILYATVGTEYADIVIDPVIAEAVKTIMAHYTAEQLIGSRDELASGIEVLLSAQLEKYNIELVSTAIEDMDFTDAFTDAVEAKQVAAQNKLQAEIEQEQKTMEAREAANRAKIEAEAEAEVKKIKADAEAYAGIKEAERNQAISKSLTKDLLQYYYIQAWDGKLPETYLGSDNTSTLLNLN